MILEIDITKILNHKNVSQQTKHEIIEFLFVQTILSEKEYQVLTKYFIADKTETNETFKTELTKLINKYSKENESNTPDFMLAYYLNESLAVFNKCIIARDNWNKNGIISVI